MKLEFERPRRDKISDQEIIDGLRRVTKKLDYRTFTRHEFDSMSHVCKGTIVIDRFHTWSKALEATGLDLAPRSRKPRKDQIPENESLVITNSCESHRRRLRSKYAPLITFQPLSHLSCLDRFCDEVCRPGQQS